jgi:hypothetical protein
MRKDVEVGFALAWVAPVFSLGKASSWAYTVPKAARDASSPTVSPYTPA